VPAHAAIVTHEHRASAVVHSRVMANFTSLRFGGQFGLDFLIERLDVPA
jgi:hypothetical protein